MRSLIWAFVASLAVHTFLFWTGAYVLLRMPVGGFHTAMAMMRPATRPSQPPPDEQFGDDLSQGDSINMSPGKTPMIARSADQTQAWLARNTALAMNIQLHRSPTPPGQQGSSQNGQFGQSSPKTPTTPHVKPQSPPTHPQTPPPAQQTPPSPQTPPPPKSAPDQQQKPSPQSPGPTPDTPVPAVAAAQPAAPPPQPAEKPSPPDPHTPTVEQLSKAVDEAAALGAPAGQARPAGDVMPAGDRESDPFIESQQVVYQFQSGRVDAQNGRWVKTIKPDISIQGEFALSAMANPSCTIMVVIDADGNVTHIGVPIYKSSGNDLVDLPCEEVLPEWKFEPKKDSHGKPIPTIIPVTFSFRQ